MRCQDTRFNKNALVFLSSNYINWLLRIYHCENCTFQQNFKIFIFKTCFFFTIWLIHILIYRIFEFLSNTLRSRRKFVQIFCLKTISNIRKLKQKISTCRCVKDMTSKMYSKNNNMTRLIIAKLIVLQISQYIFVLFVELYEFLNFCAWISSRYAICVLND